MQIPRLFKQLAGAVTGAALAFVVYQGYSYTSLKLQGLVTLPVAPGVVQQDTTRFAITASGSQDDRYLSRINRRIQEIFNRFGPTPVTEQVSSAQPTDWSNFHAPFDRYNRLTQGASSSMAAAAVVTQPAVPVGTAGGPINGVVQVTGESLSSAPSVVVSPWPDGQVPVAPVPVHVTVTQQASPGEHAYEPGTSVAAQVEARKQERLADLKPPVMKAHGKLPRSGFGIDDLAFMAIGGAIGQRYLRKKKAA